MESINTLCPQRTGMGSVTEILDSRHFLWKISRHQPRPLPKRTPLLMVLMTASRQQNEHLVTLPFSYLNQMEVIFAKKKKKRGKQYLIN